MISEQKRSPVAEAIERQPVTRCGRRARHIVLLQGHPDPEGGHFCHALAQAYTNGAIEAGHEVHVVNIATLAFPLLSSRKDQRGETPVAIAAVQAVLTQADHVVLIYPIWNGGAPALVKGFFEQVFRPTFIFPDSTANGRLGFFSYFIQRKALKGKTGRIVATMQMPAFIYRWMFHPHPEKNTLRVSGIGPVRESLIGVVESPDGRQREHWLRKLRALGRHGR